jgi:hypothetical protein
LIELEDLELLIEDFDRVYLKMLDLLQVHAGKFLHQYCLDIRHPKFMALYSDCMVNLSEELPHNLPEVADCHDPLH